MLDNKEEDLERLAEACLSTAKQIKEYLQSNGHPQMSFDQNGPPFFPQDAPLEIQLARLDLRAAARRLYDVVSGPDEVLAYNAYNIVRIFPILHRLKSIHGAYPSLSKTIDSNKSSP
jgi:hypothetical protein